MAKNLSPDASERILLVPDGTLHFLPFAALIYPPEDQDGGFLQAAQVELIRVPIEGRDADGQGARRRRPKRPARRAPFQLHGDWR